MQNRNHQLLPKIVELLYFLLDVYQKIPTAIFESDMTVTFKWIINFYGLRVKVTQIAKKLWSV